MRPSFLQVVAVVVGLWFACGSGVDAAPMTREEAVELARSGRTGEAITALRDLLAASPNDVAVAYDLAVILTWKKRNREAVDVFEKAGRDDPPEYVLGPIARAYRDQKRFPEAERWVRNAQERYPSDATWTKLLGLILADQRKTEEARSVLEPLAATSPDDAEVWLALGYAALRGNNRAGAVRAYKEALRLQPENREAMKAMAAALAAQERTSLEIRADQAAKLIRQGRDLKPRDPRRPFEVTDKAIARLNQLLAEVRASSNPDKGLIIRLRRDRALALRNQERWIDAVHAVEALRADGDAIPPYVREAEADSLLALRRPKEARRGYEEVLRAHPGLPNAQIGRFFALVEEEKFEEAFEQIDQVTGAEALRARARSFADMHDAAWEMMLPLVERSPADAELRWVLGDIAGSRGWPRRSAQEIAIAARLAPENKAVQIALAESAIRRRDWMVAHSRATELAEYYPEDARVQRLQTDLRVHDAFELQTEFHVTEEYGDNASDANQTRNSPGSGTDWTSRLYSPPLAENWRFIGGWEHHRAETADGPALRYRFGAGVQLALPDLRVAVIGWDNEGDVSQPGGSLAVVWTPTDHWRFDLGAESFASDTPLRAVRHDITADSASFGVTYTWHESRSLAGGVSGYDFSDGNRRTAAHINFAQKIVDIPHLDVSLRPAIYASANSSSAGPYFSPEHDFSGTLTCDVEHLIWRRYERTFGQRLAVTGGSYSQEHFDTGWIGAVLYEQVFQSNPWLELRYGVQWRRAIYDGDPTPSIEGFFRFNLRF